MGAWMCGFSMGGVDFSERCVVVDLEGEDFKERREIDDEGCEFFQDSVRF